MAITGTEVVKTTTDTGTVTEPTLFGIPLGRIVAFLGPHISWLSGLFATWLVTHVHFLSTFHVGDSDIAQALSQGAVFVITTLVVWLGHQKWLANLGKWYEAQFGVRATR